MIYYQDRDSRLYLGHCLDVLRELPAGSVDCCVTSPPYWGLRDYGIAPSVWPAMSYVPMAGLPAVEVEAWEGCLGLEPTPAMFIGHIVEVFREVRRVLRLEGTLWVNMGDGYNRKQLIGMPWRVVFALQADGWTLRQDIIWAKPNPMPESCRDRCTKAHEYLFLLSKSPRYHFDTAAIREPCVFYGPNNGVGFGHGTDKERRNRQRVHVPSGWDTEQRGHGSFHPDGRRKGNAKTFRGGGAYTGGRSADNSAEVERETHGNVPNLSGLRNKRDVWTLATTGCPEAHFATFPPALVEPCILSGCPPGGVALDPFWGTGTVGRVAEQHGRNWIGIEIKREYCELSMRLLNDWRNNPDKMQIGMNIEEAL